MIFSRWCSVGRTTSISKGKRLRFSHFGVRTVIGILWLMADEDGIRVALVFWKHMVKENAARKSTGRSRK